MPVFSMPSPELIPEMKAVWCEGFPQDEQYVDFFFKEYYRPECAMIISGENGIESVGYRLPAVINLGADEKNQIPVYMCLAGATRKAFRGKGNIVKIMNFLVDDARKNNYCGVIGSLLLSSREIHRKHNSMPPNVFINEAEYNTTSLSGRKGTDIVPCPFEIFKKLRQDHIDRRIFSVYWKERELEFLYKDIRLNGEVYLLDNCYYAVVTDYGDRILVRESDYPTDKLKNLVKTISELYPEAHSITVQLPQGDTADFTDAVSVQTTYSASMLVLEEYRKKIPFADKPIENAPFPYFNITAN